MEQGAVMDIATEALKMVLYISAPMLGLGMLVGLIISIFQATTQIQEQSLTFVPKILVVMGSIVVFGWWMLSTLMEFTQQLYLNMNNYIR